MTDNTSQIANPRSSSGGVKGFLSFLKNYVNEWVAAAAVLPTAITWKGMPMYTSQRPILLSLTSMFCALIMSFLFMNRDFIPRAKTRLGKLGSGIIAFGLIVATASCAGTYLDTLNQSTRYADTAQDVVLRTFQLDQIHDGGRLIVLYISIMVFAECAFFFMAFREFDARSTS
jgi:hypothetical protein